MSYLPWKHCNKSLPTGLLCIYLFVDFFFSKKNFSKNSFINTIRVPNILDPDQACEALSGFKLLAKAISR